MNLNSKVLGVVSAGVLYLGTKRFLFGNPPSAVRKTIVYSILAGAVIYKGCSHEIHSAKTSVTETVESYTGSIIAKNHENFHELSEQKSLLEARLDSISQTYSFKLDSLEAKFNKLENRYRTFPPNRANPVEPRQIEYRPAPVMNSPPPRPVEIEKIEEPAEKRRFFYTRLRRGSNEDVKEKPVESQAPFNRSAQANSNNPNRRIRKNHIRNQGLEENLIKINNNNMRKFEYIPLGG